MNTQQICRFFATIKGCRNGSECNFLHTEQVQQKQPQQRLEQQEQCPRQQRFQQRFQQRPQQQQERQERKPTVLCKFFPNCHKGSLCTFLHPQEKQEKQEKQEQEAPEPVSSSASAKQEPEKTDNDDKKIKVIITNHPYVKEGNKVIRHCYFFNSVKGCRNGDTCAFVHQEYQD